jgi:hypothetical protein
VRWALALKTLAPGREKTWIEWEKSGIQQRKWKIYRNLMEIVGLIGFNQPSNCDCTIFKMI